MGNHLGKGKREWGANGGGGGQFTANQGSEWTGSHHDTKEGFQVSRKGVQEQGCGDWVLMVFWGTLFQLAVSPFNWIDSAMQDVGRKVGLMLKNEAARGPEAEEMDGQSMKDLQEKYPWWRGGQGKGLLKAPAQDVRTEAEDTVSLTQGKSLKV
jgi:hypothetical protein